MDPGSNLNSSYLLATNFEQVISAALGLSFFNSDIGILPPVFPK